MRGTLSFPGARRSVRAVHPRACGEHSKSGSESRLNCGSSPRMRGTLVLMGAPPQPGRFIPAHAGNTPHRQPAGEKLTVHPRACGEHSVGDPDRVRERGSSPRMRGTRSAPPDPALASRFIPAHAGNTQSRRSGKTRPPVHPRACGEHSDGQIHGNRGHGSSPRMRGTRALIGDRCELVRFIPAHAGNTGNSCIEDGA